MYLDADFSDSDAEPALDPDDGAAAHAHPDEELREISLDPDGGGHARRYLDEAFF